MNQEDYEKFLSKTNRVDDPYISKLLDFMFTNLTGRYMVVEKSLGKEIAKGMIDRFFVVFILETSNSIDEAMVRLNRVKDKGTEFYKLFDRILNDVEEKKESNKDGQKSV
jgi:hypothetical protein